MWVTLQGNPAPDSSDRDYLKRCPPGGVVVPTALRPSLAAGYVQNLRALMGGAPLLIAADLHTLPMESNARVIRFNELPTPLAIGATRDLASAARYGAMLGESLAAMGFNVHLGPQLALGPTLPEAKAPLACLGGSPEFTGDAGEAIRKALEAQGALCLPLGFPGGGFNRVGNEPAVLSTSPLQLAITDLAPYAKAIQGGVPLLQVSDVLAPSLDDQVVPSCVSKAVVTDLLRGQMGFKGVVVAGPMDAATVTRYMDPAEASLRALEAGADMLLWQGGTPQALRTARKLAQAVDEGRLSKARVDEAYERVSVLLARIGALTLPGDRDAARLERNKKLGDDTYAIARRAVTLAVNRADALPLAKDKGTPVAIIGTMDTEPLRTVLEKRLKKAAALDIVTARHLNEIQDFEVDRAVKLVQGFKTAVCVIGSGLKNRGHLRLVQQLREQGVRVVVVLLGAPVQATQFLNADALVFAYASPASCGETLRAVGELLVGEAAVGFREHPPVEQAVATPLKLSAEQFLRVPAGVLPCTLDEKLPMGFSVPYAIEPAVKKVEWDFGDGKRAKGLVAEHVFESAGRYPVKMTVTDITGETRETTIEAVIKD